MSRRKTPTPLSALCEQLGVSAFGLYQLKESGLIQRPIQEWPDHAGEVKKAIRRINSKSYLQELLRQANRETEAKRQHLEELESLKLSWAYWRKAHDELLVANMRKLSKMTQAERALWWCRNIPAPPGIAHICPYCWDDHVVLPGVSTSV